MIHGLATDKFQRFDVALPFEVVLKHGRCRRMDVPCYLRQMIHVGTEFGRMSPFLLLNGLEIGNQSLFQRQPSSFHKSCRFVRLFGRCGLGGRLRDEEVLILLLQGAKPEHQSWRNQMGGINAGDDPNQHRHRKTMDDGPAE